jgi:uncharacterized protein YabN with tetrapyrrole methylase and pyrophosphatase domain
MVQWDHLKRRERGAEASRIAAPPRTLPALSRAQVAQRRAARIDGERDDRDARRSIDAALGILAEPEAEDQAAEAAVGELLFAAVEIAGRRGVDAEEALRERVEWFIGSEQGADVKAGTAAVDEGIDPA